MIKKLSVLVLLNTFLFSGVNLAYSEVAPVKKTPETGFKQTIYVPAYSSIFHGDKPFEFDLAITLSIRNTNLKNQIILNQVDYYDTKGKLAKVLFSGQRRINPLETVNFIIKESDHTGGTVVNFIVNWQAPKKVNQPLIESVMIGTGNQQGVSFTSRGVIINPDN